MLVDLRIYTLHPGRVGPFLKLFEAGKCHDYVACDVTAAYDGAIAATNGNPAKVKEATRQFVSGPYRLEVLDAINHWVPELAADHVAALVTAHVRTAG